VWHHAKSIVHQCEQTVSDAEEGEMRIKNNIWEGNRTRANKLCLLDTTA